MFMDLRKNDLEKIAQAYKDGLAIREKLTDSNPKFIKGGLDKIASHYMSIPTMRKGEDRCQEQLVYISLSMYCELTSLFD